MIQSVETAKPRVLVVGTAPTRLPDGNWVAYLNKKEHSDYAGRNRIWRDMGMQDIKHDPAWNNGDYTTEPLEGLRGAVDLTIIAASGALQLGQAAPTGARSMD